MTNFGQRAGFHIIELQLLSYLALNNDIEAFGAQPAIEHFMCRQGRRVTRVSYNTDTLEMIVHFLNVLVPKIGDNVRASLETRNLIPIISQVSEMIAKKRGEIHE